MIDISIHDEIGGWGVSAKDFIQELRGHKDIAVINLSIHSPGGNVLDGFAIHNVLKGIDAKIYAHVEGIAASAASFILMAGDVITMPEDAFVMVHNAWGFAMGDSEEMRKTADIMDKLQESIINIYENRTGLERETVVEMMSVETWMNADDALSFGFIDMITDKVGIAAKIKPYEEYFTTLPVQAESHNYEAINNVKSFEKFLRDAGVSKKEAEALTSRAKVIFQGDPEGTDAETVKKFSEALDKVGNSMTDSALML